MKLKSPTENQIQRSFFDWAAKCELKEIFRFALWHTPNEIKTSSGIGFHYNKMGRKSGVPDVIFARPSRHYHGMFIEFKSKNGRLTIAQAEFLQALSKDYYCVVCHSLDEAMAQIYYYLNLK